MIRNLLAACAGIALTGGITLGVDVSGTYAGQSNGQAVSVQLQGEGGAVRGMVRVGGAEMPLAGQEANGQIRGVWQAPNGQQFPFVAQVQNGQLLLNTNGMNYSLSAGGTSQGQGEIPPAAPQQDIQPQQAMPSQAIPQQGGGDDFAAGPMQVRMEQGSIFARPVPAGWQSSESCNETYVIAPDQTMAIGFTGYEGTRPATPAQFMEWMIVHVYKHSNFQILQQKEVERRPGSVTVEAVVTYDNRGHACKCWVRCNVLTAYGSSNGYMLFAATTPEKFDRVIVPLAEMATKIQIIDNSAVFNRAARLGVIRSVKNNPIPDTVVIGYNQREKIMDGIGRRRHDVATDTYKLTSDSGQVYYMGQNAYDPAIGGFRDPENPNRTLHMQQHWNGQ